MPTESHSRLRRRISRMVAPQHMLHAQEESDTSVRLGGTPVAELASRAPAVVCGTLRSVTLRPRAGVPALVAELYDGTGTVSVVWLGRRQIAGIEPGRRIIVRGMVTVREGERVIFNPRYDLVPGANA